MDEENLWEVVLLAIFMILLFSQAPPTVYKEFEGCFPDYRPGIRCQAYEKLPY